MLVKERWTNAGGYVTLLQSLPISEAEEVPPWAQSNFSYRFTGEPPIEVYECLPEFK